MIHPKLDHICTLTVELADIIEMGQGRGGQRRIIPIIGGTATGAHLNGKILNLGTVIIKLSWNLVVTTESVVCIFFDIGI
ncbi:MAG TPA: hypothetical protein DD416_07060, partial [Rhodobacteraceae bacterium]|nr:hypothetical protein [Paracoccaceae bacterium]